MDLVIHIEGLSLFYNRPDNTGTDLWMLADAHHLARILPLSRIKAASSGLLTPTEISLAGWGVTIHVGQNHTEIPAGIVTMPDPTVDTARLPRVSDFNSNKKIRKDLEAATPDNLPPTLNSMVRLRGGKVENEPPDQSAKYKNAKWDFGNGKERLLTHRFKYTVSFNQNDEPIRLVLRRGSFTEWVEFDTGLSQVSIKLVTDDVKGHKNIEEVPHTGKATLKEWAILHRCFEVPDTVMPQTTLLKVAPGALKTGDPIGGADPMCPGGQIP